jgi:hypothetical protein
MHVPIRKSLTLISKTWYVKPLYVFVSIYTRTKIFCYFKFFLRALKFHLLWLHNLYAHLDDWHLLCKGKGKLYTPREWGQNLKFLKNQTIYPKVYLAVLCLFVVLVNTSSILSHCLTLSILIFLTYSFCE